MIKKTDENPKKIYNKNHHIFKNTLRVIIALVFFGIQIAFYWLIFFGINIIKGPHPNVYRWIYGIVQWTGIVCVFLMYRKRVNFGYKLSWTIFILLCPFLGTTCYLLFGNGRVVSKRKRLKISNYLNSYELKSTEMKELEVSNPDFSLISTALTKASGYPMYKNSRIEFFNDAEDKYKDMLEKLKSAKKYIFMEYFVFVKGKMLNELMEILRKKGSEGVEIKILSDDVGSFLHRDKKMIVDILQIPNLSFKLWEPVGFSINPRVNYRDHRKICIVDGLVAYTGGDNIADEYVHYTKRFGYWRDTAVRIEGEAVKSFVEMFISMWYMTTNTKLPFEKYITKSNKVYSNNYILPFGDGPMNRENPAYHMFLNMINSAKKSILISTPYFIIDNEMTNAICEKAKQGVDVKILIPAIPDKKLAYILTRTHVGSLLPSGVKVYYFTPGFNHAKEIIIDNKYAYTGTVNMDYRSLILHFEDGVFFVDTYAVNQMYADFENVISKSTPMDYLAFKKRNIFIKFAEFILQIVSPLF